MINTIIENLEVLRARQTISTTYIDLPPDLLPSKTHLGSGWEGSAPAGAAGHGTAVPEASRAVRPSGIPAGVPGGARGDGAKLSRGDRRLSQESPQFWEHMQRLYIDTGARNACRRVYWSLDL